MTKEIFPEQIDLFIECLSKIYVPTKAAELSGVSRAAMYNLRKRDQDFADRWEMAQAEAKDALVTEARRRAVEGIDKPIMFGGKVVGVMKERSDKLLEFLLASWDRKTYGKQDGKMEITGAEGKPLIPESTGDIEIARRVAWLLTQAAAHKAEAPMPVVGSVSAE